jgi:uncharacterized protein (TIGR00369 family)
VTDKTRWDLYLEGGFKIPATDKFGFEYVGGGKGEQDGGGHDEPRFRWTVPEEYCNSAGNLQGGVLAAFADAVLGATCATHIPADFYPALAEMKVSFLRPAPAGTTITGTGRMVKSGKRLLFVEADITDGDGNLIAKVSGTEIPAEA